MVTKPLHTLNARDNFMLEFMRDYFKLSPTHIYNEIQGLRRIVEGALTPKGVNYDNLKSALVPDRKRKEVAFIFDSLAIESSWYGYDVFTRVIPLFDKKSSHSVLVGDYIGRSGHEQQQFMAFKESVELRKKVVFRHPTQFYIVYINNLTETMIQRFDEGLKSYLGYAGLADMTYSSTFKIYLSTMLINSFVKHQNIIIQGHEPDREPEEDINTNGYPFNENGYTCRSISTDLMSLLLSYKIERPIFKGFESDTEFALNAISTTPMPLDDFRIEVEEAKLGYIKNEKADSMARAGLKSVNSEQLATIIKEKINDSYIYNLSFNAEHKVIKFNIIIELKRQTSQKPTKLLAALQYRPTDKILRLITLY